MSRCHLAYLGVTLLISTVLIRADVVDVKKSNFEEMIKGRKFILLYITQAKGVCDDCQNLFPQFIGAANLFDGEKDILFGRVKDVKLIEMLEVKTFPSVIVFEHGSASHNEMSGDISIDNLLAVIKSGMRGNYEDINPRYTIELTDTVFEECIKNPKQYTFLVIFDRDAAISSSKELQVFEDLAATFKYDESILIASINASKEIKLAGDFAVKRYPAFYWYDMADKTVRKRYGGRMNADELIAFVNDQTHLDRVMGGALQDDAGRIPELDTLISMYIENIMDGKDMDVVLADAERYAGNAQYNKEYASYYLDLLKKIRDSGRVESIDEERDFLVKQLTRGNLSPREKEDVMRKRNIIHKFVDEMAMKLIGGDQDSVNVLRGSKDQTAEFLPFSDVHEEL